MTNFILQIYSDTQFRAPHMRQLLYLSDITNNPRNTVYAYEFDQEDNHLYRNLNISGIKLYKYALDFVFFKKRFHVLY